MNLKQTAERLGKRGLLIALATMLAFSAPGCLGPTETGKYAKQLNLPEETMAIANQLSYDANTIALLDEISDLPEEVQVNEQFLDYLKQIATDKVVTDDELAGFNDFDQDGLPNNDELEYGTDLFNADSDNDGVEDAEEVKYGANPLEPGPGLKQALDYLLTFPEENFKETIELGLDDVIVDYLLLLSSLNDQDFAEYALENKLGFQDRNLTELEIKFLNQPDNYGQELFDYYISEVNNINPELANELTKLPDFKEIDVEDIEAVEDVLWLTTQHRYDGLFELMVKEGIPGKRKYCAPAEAMIWLAYDEENLVYSSTFDLISDAWLHSSTSQNYTSDRWQIFEEVVDRLSSPLLISIYVSDNIPYSTEKAKSFLGIRNWRSLIWTPREVFENKRATCCSHSGFALYCLLQNGWDYDNFDKCPRGAAIMEALNEGAPPSPSYGGYRHFTCVYSEGGAFWLLDDHVTRERYFETLPIWQGRWPSLLIRGPFSTIEKAADATFPNWAEYKLLPVWK